MKYSKLVEVYEKLGATTKRLEKTDILAKFLKELDTGDKEVLYLLQGSVFPDYEEKVIGISNQLTVKAIAKSTGANDSEVVREWRQLGDIGKVAEKLIKGKRQRTLSSSELTTEKVIKNLRKLSELEGKGTVGKKLDLISELLGSASPVEAKYIVRTLVGDLRIGIKASTIRDALAQAFFKSEGGEKGKERKKEIIEEIQNAYDMSPDMAKIFELVKKGGKAGRKALGNVGLEAGKPIKVMLAQKASSIAEAFEKCGEKDGKVAAEYKYDGFRMMINKKGDAISLYTRRLDNVTKQFPDIVETVKKNIKGRSFIIDSEIIGYNPKTKEYHPFQKISQRIKRKYDINKMIKELPVEIKVFDIVYYNGKNLLRKPFEERTKLVRKIVKNQKYKIMSADQIITDSEKKIKEFYKEAIKDNQEGLILKNLKAPYKPGSRVGYMLKLKEELRDLDLVIVGAEYGKGKRAGWFSSFILACKSGNKFLEVGKVGTGIKEKEGKKKEGEKKGISFAQLTKLLKPLVTSEKGREVKIKPKVVVSVTFQEIQKSPTYSSGYALRFPRFTALRPDRRAGDINNLKDIQREYNKQKKR